MFGWTIFDAPPDVVREAAGDNVIDYIGDWDAWREHILPGYRRALAGAGAVIVAGALLAVGVLVRRRRLPAAGAVSAAVACALLLAGAYAMTPYSAGGPELPPLFIGPNSRYLVPALLVAAAIAAWGSSRFRGGAAVFGVLGLAGIADGVRCASAGSCIGDSGRLASSGVRLEDWAVALAVAAMIAVLWLALPRLRHLLEGKRIGFRGATAVAMAAGAAALVAGGYLVQERYTENWHRDKDVVVDELLERAPEDSRIGLAGLWTDAGVGPILPAFGPSLDNTVQYVGHIEREMMRRFESRDRFVEALRRGDYDYLVVGHTRPPQPPPPEDEWAESAGYRELVRSDRLALYAPPPTQGGSEGAP